MQKIDVNINNARIRTIVVRMPEDDFDIMPRVAVTIDLMAGEKKVSQFDISTNDWRKDQKFDLPHGLIEPIATIARELERVVTLHCSAALGQLEAPPPEPMPEDIPPIEGEADGEEEDDFLELLQEDFTPPVD